MNRRIVRLSAIMALGLALLPRPAAVQSPSPETSLRAAPTARALRLASKPVAFHTQDVDYLQIDGKAFRATIYQPEGSGPFAAILDVHGGAWVREDVGRDEHALMDKALAAMGIVVVAIDYRQSAQHHYPDSVADVNFALRWLRANASTYNASPQTVGVFGSSSGGHLVLLNAMRPSDPRYTVPPLTAVQSDGASPDYIILAYPISDPLARRAYAQEVGNIAPVKSTDIYFSPSESLQEGNRSSSSTATNRSSSRLCCCSRAARMRMAS
jgi:acetyl esterase/lipase